MRVTFRHVSAALHLRVGMVKVVSLDGLRADCVLASSFATYADCVFACPLRLEQTASSLNLCEALVKPLNP